MTNPPQFDDALAAWRSSLHDVPLSPHLADRIATAAVADFRFRRRVRNVVRVMGATTCAALLATVVWWSIPEAGQPNAIAVIDPFRETNKLFVSVTKNVSVEAPTVPSVATGEPFRFDASAYLPVTNAERFQAIPTAARAGVEPVAEPASRAVQRFVKDFGSAFALPKPKM
jgi:hypothetical protein